MPNKNKPAVLILGGAGFIGSNVAKRYIDAGYRTIIIDGVLKQTGGQRRNLKDFLSRIDFIDSTLEDVRNLDEILSQSDVIIDSMAWTSHHSALEDPIYDLKLNAESHLHLIKRLRRTTDKKIIYLGSRGQYGNPRVDEITEDTPKIPEDIQGIHKLAAESYYRVYSRLKGLNVISLRFPNCFGKNQPVTGKDIGLIGSFIRDILEDKIIEVYGSNRNRYLVYVKDLSETVFQLSTKSFTGFNAFNYAGHKVLIEELVKILIVIIGKGTYVRKEIPGELKAIDIGDTKFSDVKLKQFLDKIPETDLKTALYSTVAYFKETLNDLEM